MLKLSESGYYRYLKRKGRPDQDELLSGELQKILDESPYNDNYGVHRIQLALTQRGVLCGLRRPTRLMRENG